MNQLEFVTGDRDGHIKYWNINQDLPIKEIASGKRIMDLRVMDQERLLVLHSHEKSIELSIYNGDTPVKLVYCENYLSGLGDPMAWAFPHDIMKILSPTHIVTLDRFYVYSYMTTEHERNLGVIDCTDQKKPVATFIHAPEAASLARQSCSFFGRGNHYAYAEKPASALAKFSKTGAEKKSYYNLTFCKMPSELKLLAPEINLLEQSELNLLS